MGDMAKPFLKWAGGKRKLIPELLAHVPVEIGDYYEPFLGGGALFFTLTEQQRIYGTAVLSDINQELITTYQVVRDHVEELIRHLSAYRNEAEEFYDRRAWSPVGEVEIAARMIYLNRTCFNGLYRLNKSGKFNTPFGKYKKPKICDAENLRAASEALEGVRIVCSEFHHPMREAAVGDFVYLDPPYVPTSETSNFTQYHNSGFGPRHQAALRDEFRTMVGRGVAGLLSNSDTEETRSLYQECEFRSIQARRNINSNGSKRGPVGELLVFGGGA